MCSKKLNLRSYLEAVWSKTGYFGLLGENNILFVILLYLTERLKVYRVEKMDMGISHWDNGVNGTFLISITTTVHIVRDKVLW